MKQADIIIVGAGAAGLMCAIWAGRTNPGRSIVVLDGARKLGAKILVAGGGRCNVTHHQIDPRAYAGSSRNAIQKVLRRFDVKQTIEFFLELGVALKREETGKLFPVTDSARTVLNALLKAAADAGVSIEHPRRVEWVKNNGHEFLVGGEWGEMSARRLVLATGGKSLPRSGSDGHGYQLARALGHSITEHIFPALVPLLLPKDHFICSLSGLTLPATLELRRASGEKIISFTDSTLCTHFGLSGPSVLDISRYYTEAKFADPAAQLIINWWPGQTTEQLDLALRNLQNRTVLAYLREHLPERLARTLCAQAGTEGGMAGNQMARAQRKTLVRAVCEMVLPIIGDRGFSFAEVTAGGVPLAELYLDTLASRRCAGLYLCGEICDVDGRIGGFNFQWAWASGYLAGISAGKFNN